MNEVEQRLLVNDQRAYLRAVVDADDAYLARHSHTDPDSLHHQMEAALQRGHLRPSQDPSWVAAGTGGSRQIGGRAYLRAMETGAEREARARADVDCYMLPPQVEVAEMLEALDTSGRRVEYLHRLRDRMDLFEAAAEETSERDELLGAGYLALVAFIQDRTNVERAQRDADALLRGTAFLKGLLPSTHGHPEPALETPIPDAGDDGRRETYTAVCDHSGRGIIQGKRYSLWPGDVLVAAGIVQLSDPTGRMSPSNEPARVKPGEPDGLFEGIPAGSENELLRRVLATNDPPTSRRQAGGVSLAEGRVGEMGRALVGYVIEHGTAPDFYGRTDEGFLAWCAGVIGASKTTARNALRDVGVIGDEGRRGATGQALPVRLRRLLDYTAELSPELRTQVGLVEDVVLAEF